MANFQHLSYTAGSPASLSPPQHASLSASRSEKGTGWSSRSLGARCRNSIALCSDEQPHIGNYRLLKTIGKGNFAKVKLARHILTGREVRFRETGRQCCRKNPNSRACWGLISLRSWSSGELTWLGSQNRTAPCEWLSPQMVRRVQSTRLLAFTVQPVSSLTSH